eukprot:1160722-Pelagomonas_calceolata.AAC.19
MIGTPHKTKSTLACSSQDMTEFYDFSTSCAFKLITKSDWFGYRHKCLRSISLKVSDNLKVSEEYAVRPYMAAQQRIKEF